MRRELRHKVIAITGASAGIGAATAVEAGRAAMRVVVAARRADRLEAVAERIRAAGGEAMAVPTDVGQPDQVQHLVDRAIERCGRLDVMFANAGYGFQRAISDPAEEADRAVFDANYFGTLRCLRAAVPVMRRQGGGHVIVTSSIAGKLGLPYYGTYAATKAAQHAMATSLRLEVEPEAIDVSVLYPIGTRTEFFRASSERSTGPSLTDNTPTFLLQRPETVARRVVRCMRRPAPEIWPSRLAHVATVLWTASPRFHRLCFRMQARAVRRGMRRQQRHVADQPSRRAV